MSMYQHPNQGKLGVADDEADPSSYPSRFQSSSPILQSCFDPSSRSSTSDDAANKEADAAFSPPSSPPSLFSPDKGKATSPAQIPSSPPQTPSPHPSNASLLARIATFEGKEAKAKSARRDQPVYYPAKTWSHTTSGDRQQTPTRDYSQVRLGSPGPSRGRLRVANDAQEEPEIEGNPNGMIGRLQSWEASGISNRTSLATPDQLLPTEEEEAKTRAWWAGVQEAGDRSRNSKSCLLVLLPFRLHKRVPGCLSVSESCSMSDSVIQLVLTLFFSDPSYPRCNSSFSRSFMPAKNERTDLINDEDKVNVTPVSGREEVIQVFINNQPTHGVSGVFFDRIDQLNKGRSQQALCYTDDSDAEMNRLPSVDKRKNVKLSLRESLKKQLPLPSVFASEVTSSNATAKGSSRVFTTATYRSKYHKHSHIVGAIAVPDGSLKDVGLGARATQYNKNKKIVEAALLSKKKPAMRFAHTSVSHKPLETEFRDKILQSWELERDIERLEATLRSISNARATVTRAPQFSVYSIRRVNRRSVIPISRFQVLGNGELLDEDGNPWDEEEEAEPNVEMEEVDKIVYAFPPSGNQLHRSYDDLLSAPNMSVDTLTSASGEPSLNDKPKHSQGMGNQGTTRSSSVHSNDRATSGSGASTPRAEPQNQDAIDAHAVMNSLGPVSRSIHRSNTASTRASAGNRSVKSRKSGHGARPSGAGTPNTTWPGDGRYPEYQTFVQH
jgi:hypothetical protein